MSSLATELSSEPGPSSRADVERAHEMPSVPALSDADGLPARRPGGSACDGLELSVVIAVYNEVESLLELRDELVLELEKLGRSWEVLFVDDGSDDGSRAREEEIVTKDARFRAIQLRRNFGKAAALHVGFRHARGAYIVTMDADLQDMPAEIDKLLRPLDAGDADLVSGWKWPRNDPASKRWPSKVYNYFTRVSTGLALHDMNCGLKAYRRDVVEELHLYGDMHRYIPVIAAGAGFAVAEEKVAHRPRAHGQSKYAAGRFVRGFLDLLTVLFLTRYRRRPSHLIGGLGLTMGLTGFGILLYLTALWFSGYPIGHRPLLFLGMLLILVAGQFFTFGLLAEMMTYNAHRVRNEYPILAILGSTDQPRQPGN